LGLSRIDMGEKNVERMFKEWGIKLTFEVGGPLRLRMKANLRNLLQSSEIQSDF
jgi:hypothetical protein